MSGRVGQKGREKRNEPDLRRADEDESRDIRKRRSACVNDPLKFAGRREERCKHELIEDPVPGSQNPPAGSFVVATSAVSASEKGLIFDDHRPGCHEIPEMCRARATFLVPLIPPRLSRSLSVSFTFVRESHRRTCRRADKSTFFLGSSAGERVNTCGESGTILIRRTGELGGWAAQVPESVAWVKPAFFYLPRSTPATAAPPMSFERPRATHLVAFCHLR